MQPTPAKFRIEHFSIKESHLILNKSSDEEIGVSMTPSGRIFRELNQFELVLAVEVKSKEEGFEIKVVSSTLFSFDEPDDENFYGSNYFLINAPAIAFPYIRAYISNLTAQSGMFTITLPTFNLASLAEDLKKNISYE